MPQQPPRTNITLEITAPQDESTDPTAGDPLEFDATAGEPLDDESTAGEPLDEPGWLELAGLAMKGIVDGLNPVPVLKALYDEQRGAYTRAHEAAKRGDYAGWFGASVDASSLVPRVVGGGLLQAQVDQFGKAKQAYDQGRYNEAAGYTIAGLIPLVGPPAATAGEEIGTGDWRTAAHGVGLAASLGAPKALGRVVASGRGIPLTPALRGPRNDLTRSAVAYGQKRDIPLSAGVVSDNRAVKMLEQASDHTLTGSTIAEEAEWATAQAMRREAGELARRASPTPATEHSAGRGVDTALRAREARMSGVQGRSYDELRAIESDPAHTRSVPVRQTVDPATGQVTQVMEDVAVPADLRAAQQALSPLLEELSKELTLAQQQSSPAFNTLKNLVAEKWHVSASTLDADLGALKELARTSKRPRARWLANQAVTELEGALAQALDALPPQVAAQARAALARGRAATRAKYGTKEAREGLFNKAGDRSPVEVMRELTAPGDVAIEELLKVKRLAPREIPKISRAYLQSLFDHSLAEGAFTRTGKPWAEWDKLGPQTKRLLFRPDHLADITDFFTLAKKVGFDANPSGSGKMVVTMRMAEQTAVLVFTHPAIGAVYTLGPLAISKLLHSPAGVKALMRGLRVRGTNTLAAAAIAGQLVKFAGDEDVHVEETSK